MRRKLSLATFPNHSHQLLWSYPDCTTPCSLHLRVEKIGESRVPIVYDVLLR